MRADGSQTNAFVFITCTLATYHTHMINSHRCTSHIHRELDLNTIPPVSIDLANAAPDPSANFAPQSDKPPATAGVSIAVVVVAVAVGMILVAGAAVAVAFVLRKRSSSKYETQEDEHVAEVRVRLQCCKGTRMRLAVNDGLSARVLCSPAKKSQMEK